LFVFRVAKNRLQFSNGSSINDVSALGGRGCQGFIDNSTMALVIKKLDNGEKDFENNPNMRDVIYG
jgi:hypothetical protein